MQAHGNRPTGFSEKVEIKAQPVRSPPHPIPRGKGTGVSVRASKNKQFLMLAFLPCHFFIAKQLHEIFHEILDLKKANNLPSSAHF